MNKKAFYLWFLASLLLYTCSRPTTQSTHGSSKEFTIDTWVKTTPVKDQGRSPFCWMFAMLATIESEHLMMGDSINLSTDYVARMLLQEKAHDYFFSRRDQPILLRGMGSTLIHLIQTYGAEPYDSYYSREPVNYYVLCRKIEQMVRTTISLHQLNTHLLNILDNEVGYMPNIVFMLGMEYTPRQFGQSVCLPDEYVSLTSFSHHPFGQRFVLEMDDNVLRDSFLNIPIDSLMHHATVALQHGHPVCWEGDVSEPGFDFDKGTAELQHEKATIDQLYRQRSFEQRKTTDDHAMELCGLAHDRQGNRYFIAKNSWGPNNLYGGYMYLSYNYVKLKTIALFMSRKAYEAGTTSGK
ncbi:MAG: cysteine protease [Prevotella sp.]|nr:cysteine protease [Prevotella sp.]